MMHVLHYHKNLKLQLSGLKLQKKKLVARLAHGISRVVSDLGSGSDFVGSMLNYDIFHNACNSRI